MNSKQQLMQMLTGITLCRAMRVAAELHMMRHIIHDWWEEAAVKILQNIRKVMPDHGRLMIVGSEPERGRPR